MASAAWWIFPGRERCLASTQKRAYFQPMSLAEVQTQAAALSPEERRKLAAFLTALRMKETGEWQQATQPGAPNRDGWIALDEAKRRLLREN